ncbi:MAG: hemolysin family protein [Nocardioidaceae bacterium]
MTLADSWLLVASGVLILVAGVVASAEAALSSFSKVRAAELERSGARAGSRLLTVLDDPPRYLNTALLLRLACEITATVLVVLVIRDVISPTWLEVVVAAGVMLVVIYVASGVAPRTLGRQHADRVALMASGPLLLLTRVLGPIPRLLIMLGNALTPGKGFREGPFASEAEFRALVDLAEQSRVIESGESKMIHSVFELGETIAREVMVPRTDVVFIERTKTLRQCVSLALRSGFSRIPVTGENLDDVVGIAYLKDITRRIFDRHDAESTERVESVMRAVVFVPDSKPVDELMREMQAERTHLAIVVNEYGGTSGLITIEDIVEEIVGEITDEYDVDPDEVEWLSSGSVRVSSRLQVDELGELFDLSIDDDDVDTVGGLMAKHLGRVPIPGAQIDVEGLHLQAETQSGRRNLVGTIVVTRAEPSPAAESGKVSAEAVD